MGWEGGSRKRGHMYTGWSILLYSFSSVTQSCLTLCDPWTIAHQASLSITNSQSLLKFMSMEQWCHPIISSSVIPFSSCFQFSPASGSSPRSQFFTSGGHSIGVSASASLLPKNIQDWFPLGWTSWISLQSKGHRNTSRQKIGQLFLISLLRVKLSSENSWKKTHKLLIRSRLYVHL